VRERCCHTCKTQAEEDLHESCFDDPNPGVIAQTVGADTSCPKLKDLCFMEAVQESCCQTCQSASAVMRPKSASSVVRPSEILSGLLLCFLWWCLRC